MASPTTTPIRTAARIRREFIDFFVERHGHAFVPSSPVIPHGDPTLLFANAGMNQFKDVFLGQGERPYHRAANSQKCIRAGGKHNDLEDVGRDQYHHTFFEMLGNWSFGDYFKAEAIEWAWTLLTEVWGIEPDRLYITVFAGDATDGLEPDEDAESIWRAHVADDRVSRWDRKDNFWEMGEVGPCGPCSEIHYDGRSEAERAAVPGEQLVNRDHPDVIEIWNLVFIQFNRGGDGRLVPLPAKHVDTGMGLERVVRVLQGASGNYGTDLWTPIFDAIRANTGAAPYGDRDEDPVDIAYRVVADHVRCLTVAIADGGRPSNEKAGYVLRRILRRAARHARQTLGADGPLLCRVVPAVVASLGEAFPELVRDPDAIAAIIRDEEESFLRTLDRGLALFAEAADRATADGSKRIGAEEAFRLHDTYGFPIDLTRVMAEERGFAVDEAGYEERMEQARATSRGPAKDEASFELSPAALAQLRGLGIGPTDDEAKHEGRPINATVEVIWNGRDFDDVARVGRRVAVILDRTNHYAEAGGQVGDEGELRHEHVDAGSATRPIAGSRRPGETAATFRVEDTIGCGGYVLHVGRVVEGELRTKRAVTACVEQDRRRPVRANHTATHMLNLALRGRLGDGADQRGSLVAPDRLRFDFACSHALDADTVATVEAGVNELIDRDLTVHAGEVPLETAQRIHGVRAVFGERYPDPVRVVSIGPSVSELASDPGNERWRDASIEFCGGTHLDRTGEAQRFAIVQEQALAAGVRRITAVTGAAALAADAASRDLEARAAAAAALDGPELADAFAELDRLRQEMPLSVAGRHRVGQAVDALRGRVKAIEKEARAGSRDRVVEAAHRLLDEQDGAVVVAEIDGADKETLLVALDVIRAKRPDAAAMLFSGDADAGKVAIAASVPRPLIGRGLKAGDWVRAAAKTCGGGGGGRRDMAQAGGREPARIPDAMREARETAVQVLG